MRNKNTLNLLEDITKLNQYLYMSEKNYVEYNNGITVLKISMNEDCDYLAINPINSELKPMRLNVDMSIKVLGNLIEQLKKQKPKLENTRFRNRWEEILAITQDNLALNFYK